jgi:hypothetical protein
MAPRLQRRPGAFPWINEQRLLERRFADQEILYPRNHLVAGAEHDEASRDACDCSCRPSALVGQNGLIA